MDSQHYGRIRGFPKHTLEVASKMEYQKLLKNGTKKIRNISVNFNDEMDVGDTLEKKCRDWLNQILKRVKCINKLDLRLALVRMRTLSRSKALQIAKLQPYPKKLILPYPTELTFRLLQTFKMFFRYTKRVKNLHWVKGQQPFWNWGRVQEKLLPYHKFINLAKKNRLTSFEFSPESSGSFQNDKITVLPRSCQHLQDLTLRITPYIHDSNQFIRDHMISLSKLHNLKKLSLMLSSPPEGWQQILNSLPSLSKVEYLDLKSSNMRRDLGHLTSVEWLDSLPNLTHFKLDGEIFITESENLFKRLQTISLKQIHINTLSANSTFAKFKQLSDCLDQMTQLQSLTVKIRAQWTSEDEIKFIEALPKQISRMSQLKKLNLFLYQIFPSDRRKKKPAFIPLEFSGVLQNLKLIQHVALYSNHLDSQLFPSFLKECSSLGSQLRKLKFTTGEFSPSKIYALQLCKDLTNLENIEVLRLPDLNIVSNIFFDHLVDTLITLKSLRKIQLGELEKPVTQTAFFPTFEKLLQSLFLEECKLKTNSRHKFKSKESQQQFENIVNSASKASSNRNNFAQVSRYYYYSRFPHRWN